MLRVPALRRASRAPAGMTEASVWEDGEIYSARLAPPPHPALRLCHWVSLQEGVRTQRRNPYKQTRPHNPVSPLHPLCKRAPPANQRRLFDRRWRIRGAFRRCFVRAMQDEDLDLPKDCRKLQPSGPMRTPDRRKVRSPAAQIDQRKRLIPLSPALLVRASIPSPVNFELTYARSKITSRTQFCSES